MLVESNQEWYALQRPGSPETADRYALCRNDAGYVSRFGDLSGLAGIKPVRRMELQPYVSGRLTRAPGEEANPFYDDNATKLNAGVDVKVGLTAGLTLTGTVNNDFGQVEVDPTVVTLSAPLSGHAWRVTVAEPCAPPPGTDSATPRDAPLHNVRAPSPTCFDRWGQAPRGRCPG